VNIKGKCYNLSVMPTHTKKKFKTVALGCRTNQYEAQAFTDQLLALGLTPAEGEEEADICVVNTCTVTASADKSSRHEIRQLARRYPKAKIYVTGCYAERDPGTVGAIEGVAQVVPNAGKETLIEELFPDENVPEFSIKNFDAHTRAFVKVQDGCNSFCTYCIIPYVRGRSRSRAIDDILKEVEELVASGYREIVLTGINIGDFDGGGGHTLAELVRLVDRVPGVERLRISSIDPDEVDDALLDSVVNGKNTCQSMHIVLQSGSNVVLKRMNRKYTRHMFMESVERLKKASPRFTFTTDIIVGFPGETEKDFQETLDVMEEVKFAKVHMFPYSDRPRTRANLYPNKISPDIINERKQILLRRAEKISYDLRQNYIGETVWVLTEARDSAEEIKGHTDNFLEVRIPSEDLRPNELVKVQLIKNTPTGLIGKR
jgi:threonylcarbamoyladenosine tRNA methylthiotransferase MtaB